MSSWLFLSNQTWTFCFNDIKIPQLCLPQCVGAFICFVCKFSCLLWFNNHIVYIVIIILFSILYLCFSNFSARFHLSFYFLALLLLCTSIPRQSPSCVCKTTANSRQWNCDDSHFQLIACVCSCSNTWRPEGGSSAQHSLLPTSFVCFKGMHEELMFRSALN